MNPSCFQERSMPPLLTERTNPVPGAGPKGDESVLRGNDAAYLALCRQLLAGRGRGDETTLCCLRQIAAFCCTHHTGRFADGRLENVALEIGARLKGQARPPAAGFAGLRSWLRTGRHVLHVATRARPVGGATETIRHWVENDAESRHSLLLTDQEEAGVPKGLAAVMRGHGGVLVALPPRASLPARAWWLREAAQSADLVVLHHDGHDPVPVVALAGPHGPPVALFNHADHQFWLGSSVADVVIQHRGLSRVLGPGRRFIRRDVLLPLPLSERTAALPRATARERLGIPPEQVVLVSVGGREEYVPTRTHHFVRTAVAILEQNPAVHIYLVGVPESDERVRGGVAAHPRLHFTGAVPDPSVYQRAADLYLEGFPCNSQTALLEAALADVPAVLAFARPLDLLGSTDEALAGLLSSPATERDYVEQATALIHNRTWRQDLGHELSRQVRATHLGEGWRQSLARLYSVTDTLVHQPQELPASECLGTPRDVALSQWQAARTGGQRTPRQLVREVVLASAADARRLGDYGGALVLLWRWLRVFGWGALALQDLLLLS
jgi:hypothetical protein